MLFPSHGFQNHPVTKTTIIFRQRQLFTQNLNIMKPILHLAVILMISSTSLHSQYIPMVVDGTGWTYMNYFEQFPGIYVIGYESFRISGDTTITGVVYSKLYGSSDFIQADSFCFDVNQAFYACGLREEPNGKVWRLDPGDSTEFLAYDFGLALNDTFQFQKVCDSHSPPLDVLIFDVDTSSFNGVNYNGINRKTLEFGSNMGGAKWVEGIGSMYRLINPCWNMVGNIQTTLICFTRDGELQYGDSATCNCKGPGSSIEQQNTLIKQATLFPNPTNTQSKLTFELLQSQSVQYSLSDIQGKLIQEKTLKLGPGQHDVLIKRLQEAGVYMVELRVGEENFTEKLIVY